MPPNERSGPERPPQVAAAKQTNSSILLDPPDGRARVELAAECPGCGAMVEPLAGSVFCWSCEYGGWPA